MEAKIYNTEGNQAGKVTLPERVFGVPWNGDLVQQVTLAIQANARTPVAHTKDRSEVSGGGRKPWRQKGTGRARHGSSRSPIWKGGGVTHGPRNERSYKQKVNKNMRAQALFAVLSRKLKDGEILFVENFAFEAPKSSRGKEILAKLSAVENFGVLKTKRKNAAFVVLPTNDMNTKKSFQNFGNIEVDEARNLNVVDVLSKKFLIIADPKSAIETWLDRAKVKTTSKA